MNHCIEQHQCLLTHFDLLFHDSLFVSELLKVGSTCWSLYYLSSEPILWRQLCQRELPIQTDSAGGPSSKSSARLKHDWKNEYLARLQMQTKKVRHKRLSENAHTNWSAL